MVLPTLLGGLGVDVLTVNNRLDGRLAATSEADHLAALERLGELVSSSRAAFGVRFDAMGERLAIVDERGALIHDDRALLVLLDLVAAERRSGHIALPVTTTRVAERVCRYHGVGVVWTTTSPEDLASAAARGAIFAGDGRGGFVVPEFSSAVDALAAFVRLVGLVARTRLTLSRIDARIPRTHVVRRVVPTPWAVKGQIMRTVAEAAGDRSLDTTDGGAGGRAGRAVGAGAARPVGGGHPPVGGGAGPHHRRRAGPRLGGAGGEGRPLTGARLVPGDRSAGRRWTPTGRLFTSAAGGARF